MLAAILILIVAAQPQSKANSEKPVKSQKKGDVCAQLNTQFDITEESWSLFHGIQQRALDIELKYARSNGISGNRIDVLKEREKLRNVDEEYGTKIDRITTLLIANKCAPPDHLASWTTYTDAPPSSGVQRSNAGGIN